MTRTYTKKATVTAPVEVTAPAVVIVPTVITVQFQCKSELNSHTSLENGVLLGKYIDTQEGGLVLIGTDGIEALTDDDLESGVTSASISLSPGSIRALDREWDKLTHKGTKSTRMFLRIQTTAGVTVGQKHISVQGEITEMLSPYAQPITLGEARARIKANNAINRAGRDEARIRRATASLATVAASAAVDLGALEEIS